MNETGKILNEALCLHQEATTYIEPTLLDLLVRMSIQIRETEERVGAFENRDRRLAS